MPAITDYFNKYSNGSQPLPTTLSAQKLTGATSASITAATGWDTTGVKFVRMYQTTTSGGQTIPDQSTLSYYKATLSGTTLSNLTLIWSASGSDPTYPAGTTVDLSVSAGWTDALIDGLTTSFDQDGTLKADAVDVSAVIKDGVVTRPKLATAFADEIKGGWLSGDLPAVSTVTDNGNNSYTLNFASAVDTILSEGMRVRTTRNSAAGVTCFSLDGSNDYLNDTTVSGMTFTDDFTVSAWVYLTAYQTGMIASRFNGTSGWAVYSDANGRITAIGYNGGSGNYSYVASYQSIPLNKWVHVAAQLDMSSYPTVSSTTSYVMINGKDVPASVTRAGTNPTALIQAGNLEIGSSNGGTSPFPGYIKDVAIYNSKIAQATIAERRNQPLTGSEANLISAYSGANTTDLNTTNANNLTAQNGAVTGFASAPWGNRGLSTTLDYGLVMAVSGSTATVQVPEGCTIPTTGGVSAVAYSVMASPFGFVSDKGRWEISSFHLARNSSAATSGTVYEKNMRISVPVGAFELGYSLFFWANTATNAQAELSVSSTTHNTTSELYARSYLVGPTDIGALINRKTFVKPTTQTTYYTICSAVGASPSNFGFLNDYTPGKIYAIPSNL